jgi:HAD superfamily hydrolase (TIGR01509 family)
MGRRAGVADTGGITLSCDGAVIFDVDGTLVDSHAFHFAAYNDALGALGITPERWGDYLVHCLRGSLTFEGLVGLRGIHVDAHVLQQAKQARLRVALARGLPLRPGVATLWASLRRAGARIALASTARRASIAAIVASCGLPDAPDAVVCREDVGDRPKPDPACYLLAAERLGADPAQSIAFEDAPPGVRAAKSAGARCVACANVIFPRGELLEADAVVDSLEQVSVVVEADRIVVRAPAASASRRGPADPG